MTACWVSLSIICLMSSTGLYAAPEEVLIPERPASDVIATAPSFEAD